MKTSFTKFVTAALTGAAVLVSCRAEQPVPEVPRAEGAGRVVNVKSGPSANTETSTHAVSGSVAGDRVTTH